MQVLPRNLLIFLIMLMLMSGCQPITRTALSARSTEPKTATQESMIDFETKGQGISLRFPEDWFISFFDGNYQAIGWQAKLWQKTNRKQM